MVAASAPPPLRIPEHTVKLSVGVSPFDICRAGYTGYVFVTQARVRYGSEAERIRSGEKCEGLIYCVMGNY